ncbi:MAG: hypothetical protein HFACDABA_00247 [Anaerolineales bacterium]|nr:hypothetical protein [Anaerolineales bacterium]
MPDRLWFRFFFLCIVEGLAALAALLAIPGEGLSPARLTLAGLLVFILASLTWLFLRARNVNWRMRWLNPAARPGLFRVALTLAALLFLTSGLILFLLRYLAPETTASYLVRAQPVLIYLIVLSGQSIFWLAWIIHGIHFENLKAQKSLIRPAAIFLCIFMVVWATVHFTGLGITEDTSYWAEPGVPILGWQFALALLIGFFFLFRSILREPRRSDTMISLVLWLLAVMMWMSVPLSILKNSSYAPIQPPTNQPLPNSDAVLYDSAAQSLLAGNGFLREIPPRPLYILLLTGLHALFGQDYGRIVFGQTLLLALFPVVLYFLAKRLHSRAAGVIVALLAIFRELTSLWVSSETRVVNSKMLLADFVTTLALAAYLLLILRWLKDKRGSNLFAFIGGGALGILLLLRTQSAFLAPGIILLALLSLWPDWKRWILNSVIFALGMILAVSPWLARNYAVTGQASLDDPAQILMVASLYSGGTPTSNNGLFVGQTPDEISARILDIILQRPAYVAYFIANHFLANTIDALLVLPIFARYDGLTAPLHVYWFEWKTYLTPLNQFLIFIYLLVIALGLAAAWKRLRWLGLLPLIFFIFYTASTSLARISGWRYIFPADWVSYFYFGIGSVEILTGLLTLFNVDSLRLSSDPEPASPRRPVSPARAILVACALLLAGSLPSLAEHASANQIASLCADLSCFDSYNVSASQIESFLAQPGAATLTGRVLYPRYFGRNDGLPSTNPSPAYAPRDYPRTGFYFLVPGDMKLAVLPMKGAQPFPNAADAYLLGCQRDRYIEVKMIIFLKDGLTYTNGNLTDLCSTP